MSGEIDRVVAALYAAYDARDPEAAAALYAEDGCHREIASGSERTGRDAIRDGFAGFLAAFPDARWGRRSVIVGDGEAAVTYVLTGTLHGHLGPFEPSGQRLELRGVHVIRAPDGLIKRCEDYWDAGSFGRQMRSP
jgi:steroid delta-isomerase-like uncharacterized protein